MAFTGRATFTAGADLPELMEDVADIVGIVSPFETPLLDYLGDAKRAATSTIHEWLEDSLLPNTDTINQSTFTPSPQSATAITVVNADRFRVGDQVRPDASREVMLVTAIAGSVLTVVRAYGGTTPATLANSLKLFILGNAALEGDSRPPVLATSRLRRRNYTQIFSSSVEVSGSMQAARQAGGVADEIDYQKQERLRELLRDLENCVINGVSPAANPQGSATVRRSMTGIIKFITTNAFTPGQGGFPVGGGGGTDLTESLLNTALRAVWEQSNGSVDTIVVGGAQKRRINSFISASRGYTPADTRVSDLVSVYESDFGVCRVVLSRWVPADALLLLDSSRLSVLPLQGRSFAFKPVASAGDSEAGMVLGEYTLECLNENAHGMIRGLSV
ncbi:MAG: DUF5309 family protein [Phycisphaeraceae bacterium]|nr:DUF5309 family protein [Phycisphaeraceae bacterium]